MIPALLRQRQADLCEFEANLVYRVSSRTARTLSQRNPVSKKQNKNKQTTKKKKRRKKEILTMTVM